jgi:glutamate-ammonia-ligase adenylyltransferase
MNIADKITNLPPILQPEVNRFWQDYLTNASEPDQDILFQQPAIFDTLPKIWACSPFIAKSCVQNPALLSELIQTGDLLTPPTDYSTKVVQLLAEADNEASLMRAFRLYRRREMVRIAWRDLAGWANLSETIRALSNLADAMIAATLTWCYQTLTKLFGTPTDANGTPQSLIVLALGKLGGQELNFSSDIDLIFAYPETGETVGVSRTRTNQEFFLRLGQQIIQVLNQITADGFVFRVDMRLRPFGDSGPLVMSFAAMEDYYQANARDWERYALVKARVAAGDQVAGKKLLQTLRPFIYRRYLDFNTFEFLRNMKAMIDQETSRKGLNNNIKLGQGGIREIEFTCQAFQLIRGGRQPALQQHHLLTTLNFLQYYQILSTEEITTLRNAYYFLRGSENHLQAIDDQQTQTLPEDELNQTRLAYSMDYLDWQHFLAQLLLHQKQVHNEFQKVIAPKIPTQNSPFHASRPWQTFWLNGLHAPDALELLSKAGFQTPELILEHLKQFSNSYTLHKLSQRGQERLDRLIPMIIPIALEQLQADEALHRTLRLIESVAQRSVYLALLIERPQVLKQLIHLCAASAWIAEQITRYPLLLDKLLDPRHLYQPLEPAELDNALQAQLAHLPTDDLEMQLDSLRQFKRAYVLHVAAAELTNHLAVEVASDYLAAIADTLVNTSLNIAMNYLTQRHGYPQYQQQEQTYTAGFCIVAYGKAGGIELSYGSDLDIVFLHNSTGSQQLTNGEKSLDNNVFFVRLAQRIIHILTVNTPAGILYEVDPRLRPGGASGMLVSSLETFIDYQQNHAWTWEHQALVRARAIAGDSDCMNEFEQIRRQILSQRRDPQTLKTEINEMRTKMRDNLDKSTATTFDLKQGRGGITDIEFIIQYGVLKWAIDYPQLLDTTGMLPLLRLFAEHQLFTPTACDQLSDAFRTYRTETHRLALQNQPALVDNSTFIEQREQVTHWWQTIMFLV